MLTFFDTVRGHEFADALIRIANREQYSVVLPDEEVNLYIGERLKYGEKYVAERKQDATHTFVILER